MDEYFEKFDKDGDEALNLEEFETLCKDLFVDSAGTSHAFESEKIGEIFQSFAEPENGLITKHSFSGVWNDWIDKIQRPKSALVVVDVQNDFIDGLLAIHTCPAGQHGGEVVEPINQLTSEVPFSLFCYTQDWHPDDHASFVDNVAMHKIHKDSQLQDPSTADVYDHVVFEGEDGLAVPHTLYPKHCVQDTWGAELHKDLKIDSGGVTVHKGDNSLIDAYSAFFDNLKLYKTELEKHLREAGCHDVYVCGIATDVCVGSTALQALELGFRTVMIEDACRGIKEDDIKKMLSSVRENNGVVAGTKEIKDMVTGRDKRPEMGYKLAMDLKSGRK